MDNSNDLLTQPPTYASKKQWHTFLSYFLLGAGIASIAVGIIFFFAYNWNFLPKLVKFGLVEVALIIAVLLVTLTSWEKIINQCILTGATFLIGTLFALYGQAYQLVADSYVLFLVWAIFTLLWAFAARFSALWIIFIGLLVTTLWLYATDLDTGYSRPIILNSITWILAISTAIAEYMYINHKMAKYNYWFILTTMSVAIVYTSALLLDGVYSTIANVESTLLSTSLFFMGGFIFGWQQKRLFYIATILFASLIILVFGIARYNHVNISLIFMLTILSIIGTLCIIRLIQTLKEHWYGTEE